MHLIEKCKRTFECPVKDNEELCEWLSMYNKYLFYLVDVNYHMIQIEYPIEQNKAYELAAKMCAHNQIIIEEKIKPTLEYLMSYFPKEKELKLNMKYVNIMHHLNVSLKWLCRGLNHWKAEEKSLCYSAIHEAKENGQFCYDFFDDATDKTVTFYQTYVERWLNFVAKNYEHFKDL